MLAENGDLDNDGHRDDGRLHVIDCSNPLYPSGKTYDLSGRATGIFADKQYAYVTDVRQGLNIIDISDISSIYREGLYHTRDLARKVFVLGEYAYVITGESELKVIDVSNPSAPYEKEYLDINGYVTDIFVSEHYAFVTDTSNGLVIINLSLLWDTVSLQLSGYRECVFFSDGKAYIGTRLDLDNDGVYESGRLYVINIFKPAFTMESGNTDPFNQTLCMYSLLYAGCTNSYNISGADSCSRFLYYSVNTGM